MSQPKITISDIASHLQSICHDCNFDTFIKDTERYHLELWRAAVALAKDCTGLTDNNIRFVNPLISHLFNPQEDDDAVYFMNGDKILAEVAKKLRIQFTPSVFLQSDNREKILNFFCAMVKYSRYRKRQLQKVEPLVISIKTIESDCLSRTKDLERKNKKYNDLKIKKQAQKPICDDLINAKKEVESDIDYRSKQKVDIMTVKQTNLKDLETNEAAVVNLQKSIRETQTKIQFLNHEIVRNVPEVKQTLESVTKQYDALYANLVTLEEIRKAKLVKAEQQINRFSIGTADVFDKALALLTVGKRIREDYQTEASLLQKRQTHQQHLDQLQQEVSILRKNIQQSIDSMRTQASMLIKENVDEYTRACALKENVSQQCTAQEREIAEIRKVKEHVERSLKDLEANIEAIRVRYQAKDKDLNNVIEDMIDQMQRQLNLSLTENDGSRSNHGLDVFK